MPRTVKLTVFVFFIGIWSAQAQNKVDTVLANQQLAIGDSLFKAGKFNKATHYYDKYTDIYRKAKNWDKYIHILNKKCESLWKMGRLDEALKTAETVSSIGRQYFENNHVGIGKALEHMAIIYSIKGDYDKSQQYAHKSLDLRLKIFGEKHLEVAGSYNIIGINYMVTGIYDKAIQYFNKILRFGIDEFGKDHASVAGAHNNLGIIRYEQGFYDDAIDHYREALRIRKQIVGEQHPAVARLYSSIGLTYLETGAFDQALLYSKRAANIVEETLGKDYLWLAAFNVNIGLAYKKMGADKQALSYYQKSLAITKKAHGEDHPDMAAGYINIGNLLCKDKKPCDESLKYYEDALRIRKKAYGEINNDVAKSLNSIGAVYTEQGLYDKALTYFEKAIEIQHQVWGETHPDLAESYMNLGDVYLIKNDLENALKHYQKSLGSNVPDFTNVSPLTNPSLENYLHQNRLLNALNKKAATLEKRYVKNKNNIGDLTLSLQTFQLCDTLIDKIRQSILHYDDKIEFAKIAHQVYTGAVRVSYWLQKTSGQAQYLSEAFYFSEKSKAMLLGEKLSDRYAKQFAGLPDSLVLLEKKLKIKRGFYRAQIQTLKIDQYGYDTTRIRDYESNLFLTNEKLDSLKLTLEHNYPKFQRLKHVKITKDITEIQTGLNQNQALLEYFEGDNWLYVFAITKNTFKLFTIKNDAAWVDNIQLYIDSFDPAKISSVPDRIFNQFTTSGYYLYSRLLAPILTSLPVAVDHLTIIPDGKLSYVPWGVLIRRPPRLDNDLSYKSLDYLFNEYSVSYAHSANLLLNKFPGKAQKPTGTILALAPTYPPSMDHRQTVMSEAFREALVPLDWTGMEIESISKAFNGNFIEGPMATEKVFKTQAGQYQILHLAMHALVDNDNAMLSKLVFSQGADSTEDGMLHTYELFNMDLCAELAVLSACKTGIGELQKGEGVMSLGRAFSYAGCPSIVMSHWSVPDQSTAQLMGYFYEALATGKSKDVAMQEARKVFLRQKGQVQEHPLYWGGFVVLGDTKPLAHQNSRWLYWIVGLATLFVALFVARKKFLTLSH